MCTYFFKDLITGYCLYPVNMSIPNCFPFSNWCYYPHLVAMDLTSREIHVFNGITLQSAIDCEISGFALFRCIDKSTMWIFSHLLVTHSSMMVARVQMEEAGMQEFNFKYMESMTIHPLLRYSITPPLRNIIIRNYSLQDDMLHTLI